MKKGFTLVELMVVIVIIGILAAVAMPKFAQAINYARVDEALKRQGYHKEMVFSDVGGSEVVNGLLQQFNNIQDSTKYDSIAVRLIKIANKETVVKKVPAGTTIIEVKGRETKVDTVKVPEIVKQTDTVFVYSGENFAKRDKYYKKLADNLYLVYKTDQLTTLNVIEEIKTVSGKTEFEVTEELGEGIIIKMEW
jgi:prepilin-type N-terminal cleavage/methylation domain-containing protein